MSLNLKTFISILTISAVTLSTYAADSDSATTGESKYLPWERGSIKIGGFVSTFDSTLTFGRAGSGATFNGEDRLGLDSSLTVIRADAMFRLDPERRHQLDVSYGGYHRDGNATLSEDVNIGGTTYPIGAAVDSTFDFDVLRATYTYALVQRERTRIALGLGLYVLPVEYRLDIATASGRNRVNGADTVIPMPAAALRADFQILPKLFFIVSVDGMYLATDDFSGSLMDATAGFEYRPWEHVGFGIAYNGTRMEIDSDGDKEDYPGVDFAGSVKVHYNGLMFYGKYSF